MYLCAKAGGKVAPISCKSSRGILSSSAGCGFFSNTVGPGEPRQLLSGERRAHSWGAVGRELTNGCREGPWALGAARMWGGGVGSVARFGSVYEESTSDPTGMGHHTPPPYVEHSMACSG